jgi:hypothetical protein
MNNSLGNQDCPPIMSDGRHFTDYRPNCYVHDLILKQNGITNSYDMKYFMTHRASELQTINRNFYDTKNSCTSCGGYYLPDPNNTVSYWRQYDAWLKYQRPVKSDVVIKTLS